MDLSSFILSNREAILAEWENNARHRVPGDQHVEIAELRDHLGELLDTVAHDISAPKATRHGTDPGTTRGADGSVESVAEKHGARRAQQGMTLQQVVSEFPILRSCVAQLWVRSQPDTSPSDLESLIRFDEAIDFALTESVAEFMGRLDRSRGTFLGILGHDLRDPLSTVILGGQLLLEGGIDDATAREVVTRIVATGERMHHLVTDLLEAVRTQLGGHIPLQRREADLGDTVRNIVGEFTTAHPDRDVHVSISGDSRGQWDDKRIGQAVANLTANAFRYGADGTPIGISVAADDEVTIAVHNDGPAIPEERRASLFDPFVSVNAGDAGAEDSQRLGLGLYIAKAIVDGHGGRIAVDSTPERGTTFTIHLPWTSGD